MEMKLTSEHFASVGLTIWQPARGHRYGDESLALAEFVRIDRGLRICELGSGVGVVSLVIAARYRPVHVMAVEIQRPLHDIALRNVSENGLGDVVTCVNGDMRQFAKGRQGSFDVVVSNPPFYARGEGRLSPDSQRAQARHELNGTIEDFVQCAHALLKEGGLFFVVFDKKRNKELDAAISANGFRVVRSEKSEGSAYFLYECISFRRDSIQR